MSELWLHCFVRFLLINDMIKWGIVYNFKPKQEQA